MTIFVALLKDSLKRLGLPEIFIKIAIPLPRVVDSRYPHNHVSSACAFFA